MKYTKYIKYIIGAIVFTLLGIVLAGVYKFNYLASKDSYTVDGNKKVKVKEKEIHNTSLEAKNYEKKRTQELKEMHISLIDSLDALGNKVIETVYEGDMYQNPLKGVSLLGREVWFHKFKGMSQEEILKKYPGFIDEDFKNTGELLRSFDFDILLNNFLKRVNLQPQNGEDIEKLIDDLKSGVFLNEEPEKKLMEIKIPYIRLNKETGMEMMDFKSVFVDKSPKILSATYKKLFNEESDNNKPDNNIGNWNGIHFVSVSLEKDKEGLSLAKLNLEGNWYPNGDMSAYYFIRLINTAAFQYPSVDKIVVYLNGKVFDWCIDDASGGEGACPEHPELWNITREEFKKSFLTL